MIQNIDIKVSFEEGLSTESICRKMLTTQNAHLVLWYAGPYGLKEGAVDFYKKHFLSVIASGCKNTTWLYDLIGWSAFQNPKGKITSSSAVLSNVEEFKMATIKCIKSSEIFKSMIDLQNPTLDELKARLVDRQFVWEPSKNFENKGITLGSVFKNHCPLFESFYDADTSKSYSLVQYAEGFFVIEKVLQSCENTDEPVTIVFGLPNDEAKYYKDENESFQKDLHFFLQSRNSIKPTVKKVNIMFLCFNFGENVTHRPYNIPGKVVKKIQDPKQIV